MSASTRAPGTSSRRSARPGRLAVLVLAAAGAAAAAPAGDRVDDLKRFVDAGCDAASTPAGMAALLEGAAPAAEEPLASGGATVGWRRRFDIPAGGQIRVERIAPGGRLVRVVAEHWSPAPAGGVRPALALLADGNCVVRAGRRLLYEPGPGGPSAVEHLDVDTGGSGGREPLNPPVPPGRDPGGVPVALVDSGVNYLLPEIETRLARKADGSLVGHDYWDQDSRPFDANPARSPFFPQRHGTRTASLLLREAPAARLVPYRYPRPDMTRMADLVRDAAAAGVRVVNISMGSNDRGEWEVFAEAAARYPDILFVLSAGNDGRDIDAAPVYPAALGLSNSLTVTSTEDDGTLAPGSNRGARSVDLMVPAERVPVTDFDGRRVPAAGSSYAAVRISALAARFLAANPDWGAPELKKAIMARTLPPLPGVDGNAPGGSCPGRTRPTACRRCRPAAA